MLVLPRAMLTASHGVTVLGWFLHTGFSRIYDRELCYRPLVLYCPVVIKRRGPP